MNDTNDPRRAIENRVVQPGITGHVGGEGAGRAQESVLHRAQSKGAGTETVPPSDAKPEWVLDDAAKARAASALADVEARQATLSECSLCGQRAARLDRFGLCSKTSEQHAEWRAGVRDDEKAGVAR